MRQRLDIADVEQRTKIRAKYLRALENEEWGLLPGPTFVKTFLRTYAEVVGVDAHLLVEEYRVNHERHDDNELQSLAPRPARDSRRGVRRQAPRAPRRGAIVAAAVVALLAFLLVLGLLGDDEDSADPERAATRTAETAPEPRAQRPPPRPAPTGVRARVTPVEPTYACVDKGPGTDVVFEGTLEAPRTFRDPRMLRMNLGRRSARVTLNGRRVEVEPSAEPLALRLRPRGGTEIAAGDSPCA